MPCSRGASSRLLAAAFLLVLVPSRIPAADTEILSAPIESRSALLEEAQRRQLSVKPAPEIVAFTAEPPVGGQLQDSIYNNGVRMTIDFDVDTDMGGFTFAPMVKEDVDSLFKFTQPLGSKYVGQWMTYKQFTITVIDWPGAGPPQIGEPFGMICTARTDLARAIRVAPPALSMARLSLLVLCLCRASPLATIYSLYDG